MSELVARRSCGEFNTVRLGPQPAEVPVAGADAAVLLPEAVEVDVLRYWIERRHRTGRPRPPTPRSQHRRRPPALAARPVDRVRTDDVAVGQDMFLPDDLLQLREQVPVEVAHREILAHRTQRGVAPGVTCGRIAIGPPTGRPYCDLLLTAYLPVTRSTCQGQLAGSTCGAQPVIKCRPPRAS